MTWNRLDDSFPLGQPETMNNQVGNILFSLNSTRCRKDRGPFEYGLKAFSYIFPDDEIDEAGFIFEGDKGYS